MKMKTVLIEMEERKLNQPSPPPPDDLSYQFQQTKIVRNKTFSQKLDIPRGDHNSVF